jgi:hypothetical protein
MTIDPWGFVLLLLLLLAWRILMWWCYQYGQIRPAVAAQVERLLKPRTPHDYPTWGFLQVPPKRVSANKRWDKL